MCMCKLIGAALNKMISKQQSVEQVQQKQLNNTINLKKKKILIETKMGYEIQHFFFYISSDENNLFLL